MKLPELLQARNIFAIRTATIFQASVSSIFGEYLAPDWVQTSQSTQALLSLLPACQFPHSLPTSTLGSFPKIFPSTSLRGGGLGLHWGAGSWLWWSSCMLIDTGMQSAGMGVGGSWRWGRMQGVEFGWKSDCPHPPLLLLQTASTFISIPL